MSLGRVHGGLGVAGRAAVRIGVSALVLSQWRGFGGGGSRKAGWMRSAMPFVRLGVICGCRGRRRRTARLFQRQWNASPLPGAKSDAQK